MTPCLMVLDAMGLVYRAHYASGDAIGGFQRTVAKLTREYGVEGGIAAWDAPGKTFRHEALATYKAHRSETPAGVQAAIVPLGAWCEENGWHNAMARGYEADDIMATIAMREAEQGIDVLLVTGDKDMLQCVTERVHVLRPGNRGTYVRIDPAGVRTMWGVEPAQIPDVLGLMGDAVDGIPGVPGIGEKTAMTLVSRFDNLESLYAQMDGDRTVGTSLRLRLKTYESQAFLSRDLATLRTELTLERRAWQHVRDNERQQRSESRGSESSGQ